MRFVLAAWLAILAATVSPLSVRSADDGAPVEALSIYGGTSGALWLVIRDNVAKELALTPEQSRQFGRWRDELRAELGRMSRSILGKNSENEKLVAEKRQQAAAAAERFHRQVVQRLDAGQRTRLDQLYVQCLGPRALFEPRIVARLALSESQQKALQDAIVTNPNSATFEKLLELLTAAQRQQLTAMQGEPFAFPKPKMILLRPGAPDRQAK